MDATELSVAERAHAIIEACDLQESANPLEVFWAIEALPFVRMHGPEHHVLDGAAFLTAFRNAGGAIDLPAALDALVTRGLAMPGAICGLWGVCGSAASVGAALSIIEGTGPLTDDASWGSHMELTARVLQTESRIGGPRCCKRNAFVALQQATSYARERFGIAMESGAIVCHDCARNAQCLGERCPFHPSRSERPTMA
jgi:hypothetical protein